MRYREFGGLGWKVSALGFGVAGLLSGCEESGGRTGADSTLMIRYAIDHGVNYLHLGYPYDMVRQELVTKVVEEMTLALAFLPNKTAVTIIMRLMHLIWLRFLRASPTASSRKLVGKDCEVVV